MKVKLIFLVFWFLLLLFPFYALLQNVKLEIVFGKPALIVGFVQRLSGLMVFTLLPLQLTIGAFMSKISAKTWLLDILVPYNTGNINLLTYIGSSTVTSDIKKNGWWTAGPILCLY